MWETILIRSWLWNQILNKSTNKKQTWNSDLFIAFLLKANEDFSMFPRPWPQSLIALYIFQVIFKTPRHENFDDSSMFCFCLSENVTTLRVSSKATKLKFPSKQIGNELIKKNFPRNYHGRLNCMRPWPVAIFQMLLYVLIWLLTGWSKNIFSINDKIIILFLILEDNILCVLFYLPHFQTIKQKVYLLLENLDQFWNINIDFVFMVKLLVDIGSN